MATGVVGLAAWKHSDRFAAGPEGYLDGWLWATLRRDTPMGLELLHSCGQAGGAAAPGG